MVACCLGKLGLFTSWAAKVLNMSVLNYAVVAFAVQLMVLQGLSLPGKHQDGTGIVCKRLDAGSDVLYEGRGFTFLVALNEPL